MNSIIVPLDTSDAATAAIEPAMELASAMDADLILVAVEDVVVANSLRPVMDSERISATQALESYLGQHVSDLEGRGVNVTATVIESNDAAAALAELAKDTDASMIVMCSHGRSGPARWLLGSTADRVIRSSSVPVHLIPVR